MHRVAVRVVVERVPRASARFCAPKIFFGVRFRVRSSAASRPSSSAASRPSASFFDAAERALRRASDDYERSERRYLELDPMLERTTYGPVTSKMHGSVRVVGFEEFRSVRFNEVEQGLAYMLDASERVGGRGKVGAMMDAKRMEMDADALPYEYLRVMTAVSIGLCASKGCDPLDAVDGRFFHIGLGAGAAPAFTKRKFPRVDVHVAEIDSLVIDICKNHLGLKFNGGDEEIRVSLGDCAAVLEKETTGSLDVIFMDAFDGDGLIPAHLSGDAFLQRCGDALKDDGSLVLNMFNGTRGSEARESVRRFAKRLESYIGPVCTYPVMDQPVNVVLSASKVGAARPTREEFTALTKSIGKRANFDWSPEKLVAGAFWVEFQGETMLETVPGKPGVAGKFKGRNGTNMPREYENTLLANGK